MIVLSDHLIYIDLSLQRIMQRDGSDLYMSRLYIYHLYSLIGD